MVFCRSGNCPFKDCENHPARAPFGFAYTAVPMDESCDRMISYLEEQAEIQEKIRRMSYTDACIIFKKIDSPDVADELKGAAIRKILGLETHNGITKTDMLKAIRYLFNLCFEETED